MTLLRHWIRVSVPKEWLSRLGRFPARYAARGLATADGPTDPTLPARGELDMELLSSNANNETLAELSRLRQTLDKLPTDTGKLVRKLPPIDFQRWERALQLPGLVSELRRSYESVRVPAFEAERQAALERMEAAFRPLLEEAHRVARKAQRRAAELEQVARDIDHALANLDTMTADEYLEKNPQIAKKIEDDLENYRWFRS